MDREEAGLSLSIGAVSRATGIPSNTLRTWERRYGFPKPLRTEGGQRAYDGGIVPHLIEVGRALDRGMRPREALTASRHELARYAVSDVRGDTEERSGLLMAARRLDAMALRRGLRMAWAERGGVACLDQVIAPLVQHLSHGSVHLYQKRFSCEVIRSFLCEQWRPLAETAPGPVVVLATPAGEPHDLGLQLSAATLALCDRRLCYLGANLPAGEIIAACRELEVEACVISVSSSADRALVLAELEAGLPERVTLLVTGASGDDRAVGLTSCASLYAWAKMGGCDLPGRAVDR